MNRIFRFFRFFMLGALICSFAACGGDKDPDEVVVPLIPAFVSLESSADASVLLQGDASSKTVSLKTNREVEVTSTADWLTASATVDLASSTATLTLTVTKNEAAFKGRSANVSIAAKPSRDDDNVSSASAKASLEVKQSLFGLPTADLFDWKADAAGNVSDVSGNATITVGPAKPVTVLNAAYGLYEATISEISSEAYPADHYLFPGNDTYASYGEGTYLAGDGNQYDIGSRRMCWYKIPWTNNEPIVNAYKTAFSYELIYQVPEYSEIQNLPGGNNNNFGNGNLFGNVNPTHCGFGIKIADNVNTFHYYTEWGGGGVQIRQKDAEGADVKVEYGAYYHVVATYDKNSPTELVALYIDGEKVNASEPGEVGKALHFPTDYYTGVNGHLHADDNYGKRTPNTEYLVIGGGSHQSGIPTFGSPHNTKIVVARLYSKALTQAEVTALFNYHKPE